jgi:MbtH protein
VAIDEDKVIYKVVVNSEEQYSLAFVGDVNQAGWRDTNKQGTKAECLAYVNEVWTDMTPLRLRNRPQ